MLIKIQNRKSRYTLEPNDPANLDKTLRNYLKVRADGYEYTEAYKRRGWDGFVNYINAKCEFLTGFLQLVIDKAVELGAEVTLQDVRTNDLIVKETFVSEVGNKEGYVLRDYQENLIKVTLNKKILGLEFIRGLWYVATNSGKTSIMAGFMRNIENLNALIIIDRQINYKQTYQFLSEIFDVGQVAGELVQMDSKVTIAMSKTLSNRLKSDLDLRSDLAMKNVIICDEAHRSVSDTYKNIFEYTNSPCTILMSGTLLDIESKANKTKMIGNAGMILGQITNQDIIEKGVSLPPIIYIHQNKELDSSLQILAPYEVKYRVAVMFSKDRAETIIREFNKDVKQVAVVSVEYKEHGQFLYDYLLSFFGSSVSIEFSHGEDKERHDKIELLKQGKINIFISTSILQESANIPCITTLFYMRGGKSKVAMKQWYGRCARQFEDLQNIKVHDFFDIGLEEHSHSRVKTWKKEGFEIVNLTNVKV